VALPEDLRVKTWIGHLGYGAVVTDWGTSAIADELAGVTKGFDLALTVLADAADYAGRAAERMAGLQGVARGIRDIQQAIEANREHMKALAGRVAPLTGTMAAITTDSTPGQVIATLDPVPAELGQRVVDTMRTKAALGDTETLIRRNLEGGQPEHLLYRVGKARSVLDVVRLRLDKAKQATDGVLSQARAAGGAEQTAAAGGGQEPPAGPLQESGEPEPLGDDLPSYVRRVAAELPDAGAKTVGRLVDRSGQPLSGVLWSGKEGPGRDAPGIRVDGPKPWARMKTVRQHVEGHAAAVLRRPGAPSEAVLVLTREPCDGQYGCDRIMPETLPRGTRLWVYVVGTDGVPYLWRGRPYSGNGLGAQV
jgi:nucleic acid/nucleotide deaminase of polymorphic system toxin/uncharacterized protein DUF6244